MTAPSSRSSLRPGVPDFRVDVRRGESPCVVIVSGEVDLHTAPVLERQLQRLLGHGAREIVLDLAGVTFLDASALTVLVRTVNCLRRCNGRVDVRAPSRSVRRTLQLTGLDAVFLRGVAYVS